MCLIFLLVTEYLVTMVYATIIDSSIAGKNSLYWPDYEISQLKFSIASIVISVCHLVMYFINDCIWAPKNGTQFMVVIITRFRFGFTKTLYMARDYYGRVYYYWKYSFPHQQKIGAFIIVLMFGPLMVFFQTLYAWLNIATCCFCLKPSPSQDQIQNMV